ncbi:MAG TPA: response regulator [Spirochaetota bacterium]|nr:response regulator [Spirochaetota bacterium]HOD14439.1 response regulator [Spirochaetota bacterium]HPG51547.1 response regulator [Spirochaetota bacterium]HPN12254.1 response regulator [Spirochaetota bacterium]
MQRKNLILIIDDDPDILSSLKLTLESAGYKVVSAMNGAAGIQMFNETAPGLIICDIMMEKIDTGIRFVREIRQKDKDVPIYLLSDIGRLTAANIDLNEIGCSGSFQKPFDTEDLLRVIRQKMGK